ncbi:hypothetical protein K2173_010734 [Erythroxylum novogranatense]|uniref:RING-type domain-containing protein n=1 Tax=Erythroxylum novogranatense TaxID=1862640 RepID=A0AAV8SRE7_9ROSI|nr:hypothetical protein K2173_010734 [Erythroxylum novogranatense]
MGNKLGRKRQVVDERYTRPQGLYIHKDVDHKKLRKLILELKLAPCYPGDEEHCNDHEECPICFMYYPTLNRSRCCMKGICTECFLQMKNPNSTRPTQCPFCKMSNYAVEYRGVKTKEEKGLEQIEEQRVIEAKIRIQQQELQEEEERMQKRLEVSSSSNNIAPEEVHRGSSAVPSRRFQVENTEVVSAHPPIRYPLPSRTNRDEEFDLDLEDIMVMEAIWLSIQENGRQRNLESNVYNEENLYTSQAMDPVSGSSSSPSGGLACAIAALAERQQIGNESSAHNTGNVSTFNMISGTDNFYNRLDQDTENCPPAESSTSVCSESPECGEWCADRGSDTAEAGTSYAGSDTIDDGRMSPLLPPPPPPLDEIGGSLVKMPAPIVPESFEEQMMLAMAVSLAEARAMTTGPQSMWQ